MSMQFSSKLSMQLVHRRGPAGLLLPARRCPPWNGLCWSRRRGSPGVAFCCSEVEYQVRRKRAPLLETNREITNTATDNNNNSARDEWKAIPDIWRTNSEKYGDRIALVDPYHDPPSKLTYKQVEEQIMNFSEGLRVIGVIPDEKIALFADNSSRWLLADQGIMCTGTVSVVRGTKSSDDELFQIYSHSDSVALVVDDSKFLMRLTESFIPRVKSNIKFIILLWGDKSGLIKNSHLIDIPLYTYNEVIKQGQENRLALKQEEKRESEKIKPDDVATLMYTSGTSGMPKGVMLTHRNLLHQVNNLWEIVPCQPGDRFLSMLPSWHAYERASEYFIFTHGVEQVYTNVKFLKEDLKRYQPEYLISVPLVYETLYNSIQKQISTSSAARKFVAQMLIKISLLYMELKRIYEGKVISKNPKPAPLIISILEWIFARIFASILLPLHNLAKKLIYSKIHSSIGISKAGISGGGSLPMHIDKFFEAIGIIVQNGYGLTETSPVVAARRPDLNVLGTIGHPINHTEIKILDPQTNSSLPNGSKGILKIKGPQVTKGYYKNQRVTEEALDGSGWFSTGDVGWIVAEHGFGRSRACGGMIVLEGRAKDTIVLSTGENVEPSEIEEAAMRSDLISQIVVVGQDQRRLGAIIVPNKDEMLAIVGDKMELTKEQIMTLLYGEVRTWTAGCTFQIGPILIVDEPFTVENGLMTPTMKVRRDKVTDKYHDQIAIMYK